MSNPKHNQPAGRAPIPATDLDERNVRERRGRATGTTYRAAPEAPATAAKSPPPPPVRSPRPAVPLIPPETNRAGAAGGKGEYAGSVINAAIQRRQEGSLGKPQPPAPPREQPAQAPAARHDPTRATTKGAAIKGAAAATRPIDRIAPPDRITNIFDRGVPAPVASAQRPGPARRQEPLGEWHELVVLAPGNQNALLIGCVALCFGLVWAMFATPLGASLGTYQQGQVVSAWVSAALGGPAPEAASPKQLDMEPLLAPRSAPAGEMSIVGPPSMSAAEIDSVLASYGSPAVGSGRDFYDLGVEYGIDPAFALAFFIHESSAGTAPGWAGLKPDGSSTHNVGNIICAGYPTCFGRFRDYGSWSEGIEDWYKLLVNEYINGRGVYTVEQIIPIYAPSFENNVPAYVNVVNSLVREWRNQ